MDHIFLLSILVFLQAMFPPASTAEELPPPHLSVSPKHPQYYEGENVKLSCTATINEKVGGYRFFDQSGPVISEVNMAGFGSSLLYITVQKEKTENYSCDYWKNAREVVRSQRSKVITLQVKEAPKKPSLTLNHTHPWYKWGDNVKLVCSAPPEEINIEEFQYFGDRQTIQTRNNNTIYVYNLDIAEPKDTGNFRCAYIQLLSGRKVCSQKSDPVFIEPEGASWGRILATGGAFFTINGLIFFITHYYFLPKVSKRIDG